MRACALHKGDSCRLLSPFARALSTISKGAGGRAPWGAVFWGFTWSASREFCTRSLDCCCA